MSINPCHVLIRFLETSTLSNRSVTGTIFVGILSDYVRYAILILRLELDCTLIKSYANTLVISNIVFNILNIQ